jgi:hypothetical protein
MPRDGWLFSTPELRPRAHHDEGSIEELRPDDEKPGTSSCGRFFSYRGSNVSKLTETVKKEFFELIPPTLFFFVALHIVALIRALMAKGSGIPLSTTASVAIAALILGKAVLIADMLPIINRFPRRPLIYNVSWKALMYLVVAGLIHYVERLIDFARQAGGLVAGNEKLLTEMVWPHFWAIQILLLVLISMYCTIDELVRVIGKERILKIFFGPIAVPNS